MSDWNRRDFIRTTLTASATLLHVGLPLIAHSTTAASSHAAEPALRRRLLLDDDWYFHFGHVTDPARDFGYSGQSLFSKTGGMFDPSKPDFDLAEWKLVNVPHDWAVELPFVSAPALESHGYKPLGREYPETSIGWYRRTFRLDESDRDRSLFLRFDGVFRDSIVAVNGIDLGRHASGYTPVTYDISDLVHAPGGNVIVVRVDATLGEGWWYEGAGIYRHVWLNSFDKLHFTEDGTFISSAVASDSARLHWQSEIDNADDELRRARVKISIHDADGKQVAAQLIHDVELPARSRRSIDAHLTLKKPTLWSLEQPSLYTARAVLEDKGRLIDIDAVSFGIREIRFDPQHGLFLNGKHIKVKGTCNHQDFAGVGTALPDRIHEYRVERLKEMGSNAYRMSHNPPTPALLDACDRLGVLVLDETRMMSSSPEGLKQLETMVRRDRNHPSVFMWSIGNEESDVQGNDTGKRIAESMRSLIKSLDPTRPVTEAMNDSWGKGLSAVVDVQGFNYHSAEQMDAFHRQFPEKPTIGTETGSTVSTRGIYANDKTAGYVSAYDLNAPPWAQLAEYWWKVYAERDYVAGGFAWTGFDYRGEPTPYSWPCINSHFGIMDMCGFSKDNFYYYQSQWSDKPVLHLLPHWNWAGREGQFIDVWCYSNASNVELLLNAKSLGVKAVPRYGHVEWKVPYQPGTLTARAFTDGKLSLTQHRVTSGPAARLTVVADRMRLRADGHDVALLTVEAIDAHGIAVPTASDRISFTIKGAARLIGVGNGDPSSHEPDKSASRKLFNGKCLAIVQSSKAPGEVEVSAASEGLQSASTTITVEAPHA